MDWSFWATQGPGWLLLAYLVVTQCASAINYDLGVRMGWQEPEERATQVGVAFWWGFALGDLVLYVPLFGLGLIGHWLGTSWGAPVLSAALGITLYWPIVCLAAAARARNAKGWSLPNERDFWIVLPAIVLWALWALWALAFAG